jgi:hypothetical protein
VHGGRRLASRLARIGVREAVREACPSGALDSSDYGNLTLVASPELVMEKVPPAVSAEYE